MLCSFFPEFALPFLSLQSTKTRDMPGHPTDVSEGIAAAQIVNTASIFILIKQNRPTLFQ